MNGFLMWLVDYRRVSTGSGSRVLKDKFLLFNFFSVQHAVPALARCEGAEEACLAPSSDKVGRFPLSIQQGPILRLARPSPLRMNGFLRWLVDCRRVSTGSGFRVLKEKFLLFNFFSVQRAARTLVHRKAARVAATVIEGREAWVD